MMKPPPRSLLTSSSALRAMASTPAGLAWIASGKTWKCATHLALLNRALLDVASGKTKRLIVSMPPRHGKSELISKYYPAWYLGTHPSKRVILTTYGADFAAEWGRKARDVLAEWGPDLYGVRLRGDSSAANRWDLYRHTGGMNTAGVGGDITGKGAACLIIDDPVKNWQDAQSLTYRDAVYSWYQSTAYTRLSPTGSVIIVMTRWHHDDLVGRLLRDAKRGGEQWQVIELPALADSLDDGIGRRLGQALWPESGFNEKRLADIRGAVGEQIWQALYMQHPTPTKGAIYKRENMNNRYTELPNLKRKVMGIDSAFKDGVGNDYSVIATWGLTDTDYYALNVWRDRVEYPDLIQAIKDQANLYQPNVIYIEDAASGQSAIQELRRETRLPIIPVTPIGSKISRGEAVSPIFQANKVHLPEAALWVAEWIEEHIAFPGAAHDDQPDTTSLILGQLRKPLDVSYLDESALDMNAPIMLLPQFDIFG